MRIVAATIWKFNLDIHVVQSHASLYIFCWRDRCAIFATKYNIIRPLTSRFEHIEHRTDILTFKWITMCTKTKNHKYEFIASITCTENHIFHLFFSFGIETNFADKNKWKIEKKTQSAKLFDDSLSSTDRNDAVIILLDLCARITSYDNGNNFFVLHSSWAQPKIKRHE